MAQFRGSIKGHRGIEVTRLGSKASGLVVEANGWNCGIRVEAVHVDGKDVFRVYRNGGSNHVSNSVLIAEIGKD